MPHQDLCSKVRMITECSGSLGQITHAMVEMGG
jgi:hypothetical protein